MKSFDAIIGHKKIISHFEEAIKTGKVSHAYLLSGEDGSGKMMIAKAVAKALLCEHKDGCGECAACKQVDSLNHPDVIYITHEKYEIRVDDIRKGINETIDIKPYSGDYKIYIIDDADRMNAGAQNALLKTLEEPPAYAVILLLTNNKDRLLDTILSRCVSMTLGSVRESEIEDYHHKQGLEEYQKKFFEEQRRLERAKEAREMPEPVKIDPKELEYQEYQRQQAELEQQAWLDAMKRERDEEARMEAYKKRKAEADREIEEMRKNSVNRDEPIPKPRPKNDFEP